MKKNKIFISCEEAFQICDKAQYNEATSWEKFKLKLRYVWCRWTRNYVSKNSKLTQSIKNSKLECLKAEEKQQLQQQFDNHLQNQG